MSKHPPWPTRRHVRSPTDRGVFGVPSDFVGERMFFGNDRFELVRHFLEKEGTASD